MFHQVMRYYKQNCGPYIITLYTVGLELDAKHNCKCFSLLT